MNGRIQALSAEIAKFARDRNREQFHARFSEVVVLDSMSTQSAGA